VSDRAPLDPLFSALRDLTHWLEAERIPYAVIGGVAVSLLSIPRVTRDVDAVVLLERERWEGFLAAGRFFGFEPRQPDSLDFARQTRVLLVRHQPSGTEVDLSFGALPFEREAIERARPTEIAGLSIRVPRPEDLVVMKAVAHRTRDMLDIAAILEANPDLDRRHVREWVEEFSRVLEMPEILGDLEAILDRYSG
jgi:predicted nucleotidyltransferase